MSDLELGKRRAAELGIDPVQLTMNREKPFYLADDIHRLLGEGVDLYGLNDGKETSAHWDTQETPADRYKALLIGIRQIVPESEERKILRDLIIACKTQSPKEFESTISNTILRARHLLERKG